MCIILNHSPFYITMQDKEEKIRAILVSHTHWDRAWYLPYESFRFRLVDLIDRVIDLLNSNPNYNCFVLDGQTVLIEDYLEIKPEKEAALRRLVGEERLVIGPWYVLPDLFLVSGESVIRNLQYGREMCRQYGSGMNVGYVPDPFGHIAQLPQILNGFDIRSFIFMRGMPEELAKKDTLLFHWKGADEESSVLAYYLKDGYFNAAALGYEGIQGRFDVSPLSAEKAKDAIRKTADILTRNYPQNLILLNNGVDHMPEQSEIPELIGTLNMNGSNIEVEHGSFSDFMMEASKLPADLSYRGNLIGNPDHPILLNVYSSRVYLKQQNHSAQSKLEKLAEPIQFFYPDTAGSQANNRTFLDYAWKTLLKNHPHDDICGCSTDAVHDENESRFRKTEEICQSLVVRVYEEMVKCGFKPSQQKLPKGEKIRLIAFNPHSWPVNKAGFSGTVHFPNPDGKEEDYKLPERNLRAFNSDGRELPVSVIQTEAPVVKAEYISHQWGRSYDVEFSADLPAVGYDLITLVATDEKLVETDTATNSTIIENELAALEVESGRVVLRDKRTGKTTKGFLKFEYMQDAGDTYSFSPVDDSLIVVEKGEVIHGECNSKTLSMRYEISVPQDLKSGRMITLSLDVKLTLESNGSVAIETSYQNVAENGRLRMLLPCLVKAEKSFSDGHFMIYENSVKKSVAPEDDSDRYQSYPGEMVYTTHFQGDFSFVEDGSRKIWTANKGLHEYELIERNGSSWFAITLHRAVGYLSVSNGKIRRPQAGPSIKTPGAQCKRPLKAELCWGISNSLDELYRATRSFSHPVYMQQLPAIENKPETGPVPLRSSLLTITNGAVQLSSLRKASDGDDSILRVFNTTDDVQKSRVQIGFDCSRYCKTDLTEEWKDENSIVINKNEISLKLKPHQIVTCRFRTDDL